MISDSQTPAIDLIGDGAVVRERLQKASVDVLFETLRKVAIDGGIYLNAEKGAGDAHKKRWELVTEEVRRRLEK